MCTGKDKKKKKLLSYKIIFKNHFLWWHKNDKIQINHQLQIKTLFILLHQSYKSLLSLSICHKERNRYCMNPTQPVHFQTKSILIYLSPKTTLKNRKIVPFLRDIYHANHIFTPNTILTVVVFFCYNNKRNQCHPKLHLKWPKILQNSSILTFSEENVSANNVIAGYQVIVVRLLRCSGGCQGVARQLPLGSKSVSSSSYNASTGDLI